MWLGTATLIAHVARIDAVLWNHTIRVTKIDTGRRSDLSIIDDRIEHVEE